LLTLKEVEGLSLKELESVYDVNENALKVGSSGPGRGSESICGARDSAPAERKPYE